MSEGEPDLEITVVDREPFLTFNEQTRSLMVFHHDGIDLVPLIPNVPVTLGRGSRADVSFRGAQLSRRHARFELIDGIVWVEDLQSTNGTLVDGQAIRGPVRLQLDDEVRLGSVVVRVSGTSATLHRSHGLESHDRFVAALEDELLRCRTFDRQLALLLLHAAGPDGEELHRWVPGVREMVREVDRVGLYGVQILEILLVEASPTEALAMARRIVESQPPTLPALRCGIATYPGCGRTTDALYAAARDALHAASAEEPVHMAGADPQVSTLIGPTDDEAPILRSPAMISTFRTAERVAAASVPVLILGETGTGKEVLARHIHARSPRADEPLHAINCGAIPGELVESVLFGHERGAFTGAHKRQEGVFETAHGGTVLLDEIGELPLPAQVSLLRVLDTGKLRRVGSTREVEVDVRIIAATHRDLEAMVQAGTFRADLLYRINTITLKVPPLRERLSEIGALANHFAEQAAFEYGRSISGLSPKALACLLRYPWPGNIRELRNVVQRAVLIAIGDCIEVEDLPERLQDRRARVPSIVDEPEEDELEAYDDRDPDTVSMFLPLERGSLNFKHHVRACETALLRQALIRTDGNQSEAAALLDIPRRTLSYKVHSYGIDPSRPDHRSSSILAQLTEPGDKDLSFRQRIERIEMRLISAALEQHEGRRTDAARELGIHPRTLEVKARRYGL